MVARIQHVEAAALFVVAAVDFLVVAVADGFVVVAVVGFVAVDVVVWHNTFVAVELVNVVACVTFAAFCHVSLFGCLGKKLSLQEPAFDFLKFLTLV